MARHPVVIEQEEVKERTPAQRRSLVKARKKLATRQAQRAKLYTRRALKAYQAAADPDSTVGKLLEEYRHALTQAAGGEDHLSAARSMLIETTCVALVITRALDGFILKRLIEPAELEPASLAVLAERRATAGDLRHSLKLLGLNRMARKVSGEWWEAHGLTDEAEPRASSDPEPGEADSG